MPFVLSFLVTIKVRTIILDIILTSTDLGRSFLGDLN